MLFVVRQWSISPFADETQMMCLVGHAMHYYLVGQDNRAALLD